MTADNYAQALKKAIQNTHADKQGEVADAFIDAVRKRGHGKLLPQILNRYLASTGLDAAKAVVSVAREKDFPLLEEDIKRHGDMFGLESGYSLKIDPTLVGGYTLSAKNKRVDASWKRSLKALYEKVTK